MRRGKIVKHAGLNAEAWKDEFRMQLPGIEKETVIDSPDMDAETKRGRGRSVQKPFLDLIPGMSDGIMLVVLNTPQKRGDEWKCLQDAA